MMQISGLKLSLIVVGSAIGGIVVFVVGMSLLAQYVFPRGATLRLGTEKRVTAAPPLREADRFLGAHARSNGPLPRDDVKVLEAGPARLIGAVSAGGNPVARLKLRLLLNGSVYSQWTTSDSGGQYVVPVPIGSYQINGYQLDSSSADQVLRGKIEDPRNALWSVPIAVTVDKPGAAPQLAFVDPVRKSGPFGEVSSSNPIVIAWEPYPGAARYRLQIVERKAAQGFADQRELFEWDKRPTVSATAFDAAGHGLELRKGSYYSTTIDALDEGNHVMSQTARSYEADFRIAD